MLIYQKLLVGVQNCADVLAQKVGIVETVIFG
jgi:hypothetical protein